MQIIHSISEVKEIISSEIKTSKTIGLIPTMGALHDGHLSLIQEAKSKCDYVIVSIFINPTQFGPSEDFNKYPRTLESDFEKCSKLGVDIIFAPSAAEMYPQGFNSWVDVEGISDTLEGEIRPGHFRGVATVCNKLFNIIQPDIAFFGQKDYQQLLVIKKMVAELNMPLVIEQVPTHREVDGLAMSSRNAYLNSEERKAALVLSKSLLRAKELKENRITSSEIIFTEIKKLIDEEPLAVLDYIAVVDKNTLESIADVSEGAVILVAARLGNTRLIDNIIL